MNNFNTTTIIAVCAIIIIKLFYDNKKLKSKLFNKEEQLVEENKKHTESNNLLKRVQDISIDKKNINPETHSKNSFLHNADNFGTMEKGVVLDGKTYTHEKEVDIKIQPTTKKRRNKKL
jgi:hypothetical protein